MVPVHLVVGSRQVDRAEKLDACEGDSFLLPKAANRYRAIRVELQ